MSLQAEEATLEADAHPVPASRLASSIENFHAKLVDVEARVETLDSTLTMLIEAVKELEERGNTVERFAAIARAVGEWKRRTCRFNKNGVCMAWRASKSSPVPIVKDEDGVERPNVAREPLLCALCPLYEPR